jgi:hypothetical protein
MARALVAMGGRYTGIDFSREMVEEGRRAAGHLLARYRGRVYAWAFRLVREHENALDIAQAALAQPSGITSDGKKLYFADSEVSSIRSADLGLNGQVDTIVGEDLFEYGDRDGKGSAVRLQHPLGVAYHDGSLYVADTYNNKIKRVSPKDRTSETFANVVRPRPCKSFRRRIDTATSRDVNGLPSCHRTPARSRKVNSLQSALTDHPMASCGWGLRSKSYASSPSVTFAETSIVGSPQFVSATSVGGSGSTSTTGAGTGVSDLREPK